MNNNSSTKAIKQRLNRSVWGKFYQTQGFISNSKVSNDCGPASIVMLLNLLDFHSNQRRSSITKIEIIKLLRPWERIPGWLPFIGGATSPLGMVNAFNRFSIHHNLGWKAVRKSHAIQNDILRNLKAGNLISALKIWKNGGAHWVNIVHFSESSDQIYLLDPDPFLARLPANKRVQTESWKSFDMDWSRQTCWSMLLHIEKEMIIYYPLRQ